MRRALVRSTSDCAVPWAIPHVGYVVTEADARLLGVMFERRRVLVAVQPEGLQAQLLAVLRRVDVDDVVGPGDGDPETGGSFDAAVVTTQRGGGTRAEIVIELTGAEAMVHDGSATDHVRAPSTRHIVDLLDVYCPAPVSRLERMFQVGRADDGSI